MMLHHRFDGPSEAPVVVLGPSLGTSLALWEPQLPTLTRRWRVLRYDLPGHGDSPTSGLTMEGLTMDDLAGMVLDVLDRNGLDVVAYAGVSLGGAVGTTLAVTAPGRVGSLALCCTSAFFGPPEPWRERAALVRREGMEPVARATAARWFTPGFAGAEPYLAMVRRADPEGYAACCEALGAFDIRDRLRLVEAPTLVIAGAEDPATPPDHGRVLADGIPDADLLVIPEAAHLANVERPDVVSGALTAHFESPWRTP